MPLNSSYPAHNDVQLAIAIEITSNEMTGHGETAKVLDVRFLGKPPSCWR